MLKVRNEYKFSDGKVKNVRCKNELKYDTEEGG